MTEYKAVKYDEKYSLFNNNLLLLVPNKHWFQINASLPGRVLNNQENTVYCYFLFSVYIGTSVESLVFLKFFWP